MDIIAFVQQFVNSLLERGLRLLKVHLGLRVLSLPIPKLILG